MKSQKVKADFQGKKIIADFQYSNEPPWKLVIDVPGIFQFSEEADDLFSGFAHARKKADDLGLSFLCNGSMLNVYPSPMSRSMSGGLAAYRLTKGKQAARKDIVKLFDDNDGETASPEEQKKFYDEWLASLG